MVELNVIEQVYNLCKTTIVQNAWKQREDLEIHGWVIDLHTGLVKDLQVKPPQVKTWARCSLWMIQALNSL